MPGLIAKVFAAASLAGAAAAAGSAAEVCAALSSDVECVMRSNANADGVSCRWVNKKCELLAVATCASRPTRGMCEDLRPFGADERCAWDGAGCSPGAPSAEARARCSALTAQGSTKCDLRSNLHDGVTCEWVDDACVVRSVQSCADRKSEAFCFTLTLPDADAVCVWNDGLSRCESPATGPGATPRPTTVVDLNKIAEDTNDTAKTIAIVLGVVGGVVLLVIIGCVAFCIMRGRADRSSDVEMQQKDSREPHPPAEAHQ